MKKFLLLAAAAFMTVTASADWYLVGANFGWTDAAKNKFTATANANEFQLKVSELSGDIKIKEGGSSWSSSFGRNGAGDKLKEGVTYNAGYDGQNILVDGTIADATITINTSSHSILVTGAASENEYSEVYLVGNFGSSWDESITTYPLTLKSGSTTVYEGTYTLSAATSYFKMKAGSLVYGTGGNDIAVQLNTQYTAAQSGNAFSIGAGKYNFSFTLEKNADTGVLVVTADGPVTYPDNLYLFGQVNELGWAPNNYLPFTTTAEGVYTIENALIGNAGAGLGYFSFATGYGASADDSEWSNLGTRYGAEQGDTQVVLGQPMTIIGGENAFCIESDRNYDMTVNLKEKTVVVTESVVTPPEPETAKFGIVGSVNEWSISAPLEMTANENVYTYTFDELPEGAEFKIAKMGEYATDSAAWDATYGAEGPEGDTTAPAVDVTVGTKMNAWLKSSNNFKIAKKLTDVTVTFTFVDTPDTASTLLVEGTEEPENPAQDFTAQFNFTTDCDFPASDFTADGNTGNSYVNITDHQFVVDNVTLVVNGGGTAPRLYKTKAGAYDIRFYKPASGSTDAGKMTITAPEGYYIASVALNSVGAASASNYSSLSYGDDFEANSDYTTAEGMKSSLQVVSKEDKRPTSIVISASTKTVRVSTVDVEVKNVASGVEEIISDSVENAPVEYYNLNGIRVSNPENGLFIRRQGSKVEKVIIR